MHQALYRKWRPAVFDDVSGQDHITSVLKYEVQNVKFSHAYLFCGSRGTGKTTCAKILAKAVNCESPVNGNPCNKCASCLAIDNGTATDVLEMDAASNNSVENIRDIRDEVVYTPSLLKYRVYIVDEVHMLTGSAFNALLKTLEEPPSHVVFILATTELHKLPATIISRCQRFDFRRITVSDIMARLAHIARNEGITADNNALRMIAKYSQGGLRDAISLLELCAGNRTSLTLDDVVETIGSISNDTIIELLYAVSQKNFDVIFSVVNDMVNSSKDISVFFNDLIAYCRNLLVFKTSSKADEYLDLTDSEKQQYLSTASLFSKETLLYFIKILNDSLYVMLKSTYTKRYVAEMALIRMSDDSLDTSTDALSSRLAKLETKLSTINVSTQVVNNVPQIAVTEQPKATNVTTSTVNDVTPENTVKITDDKPTVDQKKNTTAKDKLIRGWVDMIDSIESNEPGVLSVLKNNAKAYLKPDGHVSIRFKTTWSFNMFNQSSLRTIVSSKLSELLNKQLTENEIEYIVNESIIDNSDDLDELYELN
ncbi:MAG: DNA polymerase III subunit gamma/tau [Clostridia bacterium]|nr:DNA polymerase III subunit gamma/tau [Clostridia bacterium]